MKTCPRCSSLLLQDLDGLICLAHGHVTMPLTLEEEAKLRAEVAGYRRQGRAPGQDRTRRREVRLA